MPGITTISAIPANPAPNSDLPAAAFPSLQRITVVDLVGPSAANRQDQSEEKRTETLRTTVNLLVAAVNAIDTDYLRRDGSSQADSVAGIEGNMPMNGSKLTGLGNGSASSDSAAFGQIAAAIAALLASGGTFTGAVAFTTTVTAPTQAAGDNTTKLATTAFVTSALPTVLEINASTTYTNSTGHDVLVLLSATGGGGGGADDTNDGTSGSAAGSIVNLPIALAPGDSIGFTLGTGGAGGVSGAASNGTDTTVTINRAASTALTIVCGHGFAGTTVPAAGGTIAGGTVTFQQYDSNVGFVNNTFGPGITGSPGYRPASGGASAHHVTSGGASPFASGGYGSNSATSTAALPGTRGSGGGGGDAGSNGGNGYACLIITVSP